MEIIEYPKIQTIWKRDMGVGKKGAIIPGDYSDPIFGIFPQWHVTEKVDGCLSYEQKVMTDRGPIHIGRIVNGRMSLRVLSYNESTNQLEYRKIVHYHKEKRVRDFINVVVKSRNKGNRPKMIVCTDNHKFYSNGQWIMAKDLVPGQKISHLTSGVSTEIKQIILGTLLGDGCITRPSKNTRGISISHSISQEGYFEFKKRIFGNLFSETTRARGGYPGSKPNRRGNVIVNNEISDLIISNCEINRKKVITDQWAEKLTPLAIAVWYMDDGSVNFSDKNRPRVRFSTNGYTWPEVEILQKMLWKKYNIDSEIFDYKGPTLCLSVDGTERLFTLIFPFICEGMKYKVPLKYRSSECCLDNVNIAGQTSLIDTEIIEVTKKLPASHTTDKYQYDLSVEHNLNYFSNSILVHNTNVRIIYDPANSPKPQFRGKTDDAQLHVGVWAYLQDNFTPEQMAAAFPRREVKDDPHVHEWPEVIIFGEAYGAKIQDGGGAGAAYRPDQGVIIYDILIDGYWLEYENVVKIAVKLGVPVVPGFGIMSTKDAIEVVTVYKPLSLAATESRLLEGIVATSHPMVLDRKTKAPVKWKLKVKDYRALGVV